MVEMIWEYIVKLGAQGPFELSFGPGGAWDELFARHEGFRGMSLLRDKVHARRYLAIEVWGEMDQREQVLRDREVEFEILNASLAEWTESRTSLGVFSMLAEAAVRPRSKGGRIRPGAKGRGRGRLGR